MEAEERRVPTMLKALELVVEHVGEGRWWFRGQGCHHWGLQPSLYRRLNDLTPAGIMAKEARLISRFRQRSLPWWPEGYPQTDWEQLFAMQHHGVPTRLLDWSESALTGLYFAADHQRGTCQCAEHDCLPTLWMLDPVKFNAANSRLDGMPAEVMTPRDGTTSDAWKPGVTDTLFGPSPVAIYGTHNSARISAQQGVFTISGKEITPLEESRSVHNNPDALIKLVVEQGHFDLMTNLRSLGITRSAVYPELTSLAVDIAFDEGV